METLGWREAGDQRACDDTVYRRHSAVLPALEKKVLFSALPPCTDFSCAFSFAPKRNLFNSTMHKVEVNAGRGQ